VRLLTLLLVLPAALVAGEPRYARLGEFQGQVEVQLTAADAWMPAERNLPLSELAWVRTGAASHLEIELDDGSDWRLGPDSQGEISDYSRLSTGQRVTLLSLDHGTAYYSGQPEGKDVLMLVAPGGQIAVTQGSRIRVSARPGSSQVAVLEGQVRFSSPAAEMDIREGTTARVEPATPSRFFLYPEVTAEPLDRWNEDRDKLQAAPASAAHVTARYGLADLDSAGEWVPTEDLGLVWKPAVASGWAPYHNGRWRYFEALGYTWVSDDAWGWLPYHNGRWARKDSLGWVWQPAVTAVFHPAEVYWLHGASLAGWGPLAPGEMWMAPLPGSPAPEWFAAGNTTFASFEPDVRTIDPTGFPAPSADQLKPAVFVTALPSPAFLVSRLDATRPELSVGSTRVIPSVPGVTFGDTLPEPASDVMTAPAADPVPAPAVVSDASGGAVQPPDGVYPVPVAAIPVVVEVPVVVNAPAHPDYARRPVSGQTGSTTPATPVATTATPSATTTPSATAPAPAPAPVASRPGGNQPVPQRPPEAPVAGNPVNRSPDAPPVREHPAPTPPAPREPPKSDPAKSADKDRKAAALTPGEVDIYRQVVQDVNPTTPNYAKALADLDTWTRQFPNSSFANDRLYYYIHTYNGTGHPDKVLDTAAPLVSAGVGNSFRDQQQVLQILVAASASVQKLATPTRQQLATGKGAAQELLNFLPGYFSPRSKPANVTDAAWSSARTQLETVAKQALAKRPALAANK